MAARYPPSPVRCPECDSNATIRTSKHPVNQPHLCLDCDYGWTTEAAPRVAASAREIMASLQKDPAPSAHDLAFMLRQAAKVRTGPD